MSTNQAVVDEFAGRVFQSILGLQEVHAIYLGDQLGYYRTLADQGPLTAPQLAQQTGTNARYAREWLEHQAVSGYLDVDDVSGAADDRRYTLPPEHAEVLTNKDSLSHMAPIAVLAAGVGAQIDPLVQAYRTGGGVSWADFGDVVRSAQAGQNRPMFLHSLGQDVLPQIPDLHARLQQGGKVADVGCGGGWSSIGIARSYPEVKVHGFDIDKPSIEMAANNVNESGVGDRVTFTAGNAAEVIETEPYDAAFAFECVHDMPDPVAVLRSMRNLVAGDGFVIVMDELSEENFTVPGSELERMLYGFSITTCLPDSMSTQPSRATGTVMRPETMAQYASEAGFTRTEVLPVEHDFFRFYRLHS